jgi:hypothetical protein
VYAISGVLVTSLSDCDDLKALDPSVCLVDVDVDVDDGAECKESYPETLLNAGIVWKLVPSDVHLVLCGGCPTVSRAIALALTANSQHSKQASRDIVTSTDQYLVSSGSRRRSPAMASPFKMYLDRTMNKLRRETIKSGFRQADEQN